MKIRMDLLVRAKSLASLAKMASSVFAFSHSKIQSKSRASTVTLFKGYSPASRPVSYYLSNWNLFIYFFFMMI